MKFGPISLIWRAKTDSSDSWRLSSAPQGDVEKFLFSQPDLLIGAESAKKILDNINYSKDIRAKGWFATFSYWIAGPWVVVLFGVITCQGFHLAGFNLSDGAFVAVVTSTTASVLGYSYIVGRYLFGQANRDTKTEKEGLDMASLVEKAGEIIKGLKG